MIPVQNYDKQFNVSNSLIVTLPVCQTVFGIWPRQQPQN